jgi:hypothetical protein
VLTNHSAPKETPAPPTPTAAIAAAAITRFVAIARTRRPQPLKVTARPAKAAPPSNVAVLYAITLTRTQLLTKRHRRHAPLRAGLHSGKLWGD